MERTTTTSPRSRARITGAVYLLFFLTAIVGAIVTPATANDIVAHEGAFRLGFALSLISTVCYVAVTALFYQLFKHVSRSVALVAAFLSLAGCAIGAVASLFQLAPLVVMGGSQYSSVFDVKQLQALAQMLLDLNAQAGNIAIVFFGLFDILIGYLIWRSTFLPRILGAPMAIAGLLWLIFLSPPLASHFLIYLQVPGFAAELALMLWLLVMGVNSRRWNEQAGAAGLQVLVR
jgi:uncharacterized protein DUF4386